MAHVQFRTNYDQRDVPIPTKKPPTGTVKRAKTLIRPERGVAPVPLITPPSAIAATPSGTAAPGKPAATSSFSAWVIFSRIITFWAPPFLLSSIGGFKDKATMQAWREKMALCFIVLLLCAVVGFATVGLQKVLCPQVSAISSHVYVRIGSVPGTVGIRGELFNSTSARFPNDVNLISSSGQDITTNFQRTASDFPRCSGVNARIAQDEPCPNTGDCKLGPLFTNSTFQTLNIFRTGKLVGYDWDQVSHSRNYIVINGAVLNMGPYMKMHPNPIPSDTVDAALRTILRAPDSGKDGTRLFHNRNDLGKAVPCLVERYVAGNIDKITPGCFASQLILYAGLVVILGLVLVRFAMACVFNWFLSERLAGAPSSSLLNRSAISPAVLPEGANISIDNRTGTAPWAGPGAKKLLKANSKSTRSFTSSSTLVSEPSPVMSLAKIGAELFAVCLVTCYSEGEVSLRTTLDSISLTNYSDSRKLLFVVADGMITGAGEKRSTPDICVSLLDADPRFGQPMPMSYIAVGSGSKRLNRAMVYAGHYTVAGRRTPTVIIVKCGTDAEAIKDKKPGNRGKRDSQLILMNFFSRVTYNDRMTPLDFDLFRKIHVLMGVTPDFFEVCLMVDADTKVFPGSLPSLVNCMHHDQLIMGVCGETRIANKRHTWVTGIQVFEYFISHHLAKAFESVFGGVSCLPGCFSMFRLKARRTSGDDWVPLIIKPEIVKEYSQSEVVTLHQKNLLLLGEDRFLTTILLRTFPNRKMMFLPQAKCRTVVPDSFAVLLSQRRRWINSTIHNLMELVLVRNLCGTFCFSMQFVVFMDLLGTVVLPIAISLTYVLIATMAINPPNTFEEAIPLLLLVAVLGLPAILILITTRKVVYVFWMLIYLLALPIWNFILPLYAFWHFDDFSWGETRKVEGEKKDKGHGGGGGVFKGEEVPFRRWEDWERSRLRKIRREERRRRDLERAYPGGFATGDEHLSVFDPTRTFSTYEGSDTHSITSSEEDQWGVQIGGYNEANPAYPPPPVALLVPDEDRLIGATTVAGDELQAILEAGFDDPGPSPPGPAAAVYAPRARVGDSSPTGFPLSGDNGYSALTTTGPWRASSYGMLPESTSPTTPPTGFGTSSGYVSDWQAHVRRRSGGAGGSNGGGGLNGSRERYGPLGPLDPGSGRF